MRVSFISSSFYPATFYGGPISATWDLSKKLARRGVEVYVSTTNANGDVKLNEERNRFVKKEENLFVKYYNEQIINNISLRFLFGIWLDIKKSDVVYIQYLFHYTVLFSLLFSVVFSKRTIISPRGSFSSFTLSNKSPILKLIWLNYFIRPFYKRVIWQASSYLEKEDIVRIFPDAKIEVINDGVNFDYFQDLDSFDGTELVEKFTKEKFDKVSTIFFSMGRLHEIKGFDVLIDAFDLFLNEHKDAKLLIAGGDDGMQSKLEKQIIDLQLMHSVFLIGAVDSIEKRILLNNCDYFALASEFESFGIVIIEALSAGKPIVLSNKTPWMDLEINNCGILANNDKNSFFNAFNKIINKKYISHDIKEYVKNNYDWEVIVDQFIRICKNK